MNGMINRRRFLSQSFAFSALASLSPSLSFAEHRSKKERALDCLLIGDWGYERTQAQIKVAAAMKQYTFDHHLKVDALMMLGDNWYGDMTGGVDSPRWKTQFEDLYPESIFNCNAYAVLGNHDYQRMPDSKVEIELAYAKRGGTRWTMPARWYSFDFPSVDPIATIIALDSNVQTSKRKATGVNYQLTIEEQAEQLVWLKAELEKPRKTQYLIVMAHHPVFSNGPHGDHSVLIAEWEPLLRKHGVHLYFAGHDHDMQHLEFEGHPTSFVLSGGGGADLYTLKIDESERGPSARKVYGFTHLELSSKELTVRHLDDNGQLIHAFTKSPQGEVRILT